MIGDRDKITDLVKITGVRSQMCHGECNKITELVKITGVRSQTCHGGWNKITDLVRVTGYDHRLVMVDGIRSQTL